MLIVGASGFAKEVLEVFHQLNQLEVIAFYDDLTSNGPNTLFGNYQILKAEDEASRFFKQFGFEFTLGVGNPHLRFSLCQKFEKIGGILTSSISPFSRIGHYGTLIGNGANIMTNTVITNDVTIGKGVLINLSCTVGHDVKIGNFVELCPDVNVSGSCIIGDYSFIGTNTTVLPGKVIGKNVIIGAGSLVSKNIPDNCLALGSPAKIIKELDPITYETA
ncbi:MAG: acetyltransferase [Pedobacter sp.]